MSAVCCSVNEPGAVAGIDVCVFSNRSATVFPCQFLEKSGPPVRASDRSPPRVAVAGGALFLVDVLAAFRLVNRIDALRDRARGRLRADRRIEPRDDDRRPPSERKRFLSCHLNRTLPDRGSLIVAYFFLRRTTRPFSPPVQPSCARTPAIPSTIHAIGTHPRPGAGSSG